MDLAHVIELVKTHAWLALAVLVVGYVARLLASDTKLPINIPDQWQPVVVLFFGTLADVLREVQAGKTWQAAVNPALVIAVVVLALKAAFQGREPGWLKLLALVTKRDDKKEGTP